MTRDKVIINGEVFTEEKLLSGNCFIGNSIAGDELTVDTMGAKLDCSTEVPTIFAPSDADGLLTVEDELFGVKPYVRLLTADPAQFTYGQAVEYWRDDALFAVFYMASIKRAGKYTYEISCTSAVGLLDSSTHYGGLYDGTPMEEALADIVAGVVEYTLDPIFTGLPVYGWLPVGTRRENLHQLLFAMGASVRKNPDGSLYFTALSDEGPTEIPDGRLFLGGKIDYGTPATSVAISEHAYIAYETDDTTTLFEGEAAAEPIVSPKGVNMTGVLVLFSGPMHDLLIENGAVLESGVNYAVIDQSSDCKLTGQKYTHTTRVITRGTGQARSLVSQKNNEVTVKDATLVSLANSENVADRVMAYYSAVRTISTDIVAGNERPGDPVTLKDPFDESVNAFVKSMDISMSKLLRASTDFIAGYVPTGIGNFYNNSAFVTKNGTWTVPEGVTKIRVVLISGGQGGYSGGQGESGDSASSSYGSAGKGGTGGTGGSGGKIYVVTVDVVPGQVFQVGIGGGGTGGVCDGTTPASGADGGSTTCGTYTSADGRPSESGYADLLGGGKFALPGGGGMDGAKGVGSGGEATELVGSDGVTYRSGSRGSDDSGSGYDSSLGSSWSASAYGGLGGGAADGANGGNGDGGSVTENNGHGFASGGAGGTGGRGRNGTAATGYGSGGHGGAGGGGGGGGGPASHTRSNYRWPGGGGGGGLGGTGGKGAPGCVIIYY